MQDILLIISVMNLYPVSFIAAKSIAEEGGYDIVHYYYDEAKSGTTVAGR